MSTQICEKEVVVKTKDGLHMRPAQVIVQTASRFNSEIKIRKGDQTANAKSYLDLLTLFAEYDTRLTVEAQGNDAEQAVDALAVAFDGFFGVEQ